MKNYNKKEILTKSALINVLPIPLTNKKIVNLLLETIEQVLAEKRIVNINGFGKFKIVKSKDGCGQNFHTQENIKLIPKYKVKFIASKNIENRINKEI